MDKMSYLQMMRDALGRSSGRMAGRGMAPKNKLLDDVDQNIGNGTVIFPQPLLGGGAANLIPELNPPRVLSLDAMSNTGNVVTVVLTAAINIEPGTIATTVGPITGILEFGNGGVFTRVEVDVPVGPYDFVASPRQPSDGGIIVSVPAGTLRVYMRHDGGFITPATNTFAGGSPLIVPTPPTTSSTGAFAKALATYHVKAAFSRPKKTLYLGTGDMSNLPSYSIPAFALRVRVLRNPLTNLATYRMFFRDSIGDPIIDVRDFAPATPSTFIDIPGTANVLTLNQIGAGVPDGFLALEFEIGI